MKKELITIEKVRAELKAETKRRMVSFSVLFAGVMILGFMMAFLYAITDSSAYAAPWIAAIFALPLLGYLLFVYLKIRKINKGEFCVVQDRLMGKTDYSLEHAYVAYRSFPMNGVRCVLHFASYGDYRSYRRDAFSSAFTDDVFYVVMYKNTNRPVAVYDTKSYEFKEV